MKVILLCDVKNVGRKGEIKEVADGYAMNFLIRGKKAVPASKGSLEVLDQQAKEAVEKEKEAVRVAEGLKEKVEKLKLCFPVKTGKEGKAFGSVSTKQITEELAKKYQVTVDKRKFIDTDNIDTLGYHKIKVELHKGVIATLNVQLVEE